MKLFLYIQLILLVSCSSNFELQEGDFLFQDLDSSPLCDAIELVTPGYKNANLSHIGFIIKDNNSLKVIEASPPAVKITNLEDFFQQSNKIIVGRLKQDYKNSLDDAIKFMKQKINIEYDEFFILDNERYYCSELIYEAFKKHQIFTLQPMTFMNPSTGDTLQAWKDYYDNVEMEIPEGQLGINPGIMSLSNKIDIVHVYEKPSRMKN